MRHGSDKSMESMILRYVGMQLLYNCCLSFKTRLYFGKLVFHGFRFMVKSCI